MNKRDPKIKPCGRSAITDSQEHSEEIWLLFFVFSLQCKNV